MTPRTPRLLVDPLVKDNPVTLHVLGICSALAVTTGLAPALTMSVAFLAVVTVSAGIISALRRFIPRSVRLIVQVTIIASLVIVVGQLLEAFAPDMARRLTVFVSLIVTNCIILARTESFALRNGVLKSLLDGLGNGMGYALVLVVMGGLRELLGAGKLLGRQVLPLASEGGWFEPMSFLGSPPGAFLLLGSLLWLQASLWPVVERSPATGARAGREVAHG